MARESGSGRSPDTDRQYIGRLAGGKRFGGEASFAVNSRSFDSQTWGELKFHDHRSSGNDRSLTLDHRLHVGGVFDRTPNKEKPRVLLSNARLRKTAGVFIST